MPYLALAQQLAADPAQASSRLAAATLPPLTPNALRQLSHLADQHAASRPGYSYALMAVANTAANPTQDKNLQAQAAWHLARAANAWVRPQLTTQAANQAETLFNQLNQPGWAAAARWQQNALPWTQPNFAHITQTLTAALATMQASHLDPWLPDCQLSLAYAHLLGGNFSLAHQLATHSHETFATRGDEVAQARCLLTLSSCLRRQNAYGQAASHLAKALAIFRRHNTPVYIAQTLFQQGYLTWLAAGQYEQAAQHWQQALHIFTTADLPLWVAQCHGALAQVHDNRGQLAAMGHALQQAREIYTTYQIPGLWADNLLESGRWEIARGNYDTALQHLAGAQTQYERVGSPWMISVTLDNQGHAHAQLGRYQQALYYLEQALEKSLALGFWQRVAAVEWHLAHLWLHLGQPARTHAYLDQALSRYQAAQQEAFHFDALNLRATAYMAEGKLAQVTDCLRQSLVVARQLGDQAEEALACRLLGEVLAQHDQTAEAANYLQQAENIFAATGMMQEQAMCQIVWGHYHRQTGNLAAARAAWQQALTISQALLPEIAWLAHAGLAATAPNTVSAIGQYRQSVAALQQMRRRLWQPDLAGSFLNNRVTVLDQAVAVAALAGDAQQALHFMEEGKAQTMALALHTPTPDGPQRASSNELQELAAEIEQLQTQMRVTLASRDSFMRTRQEDDLRQHLKGKVQAFAALKSRLERQQWTEQRASLSADAPFRLAQFRQQMPQVVRGPWAALDYYLTDDRLYLALVTPDNCHVWAIPRPGHLNLALRQLLQARPPHTPLYKRDLATVGDWLFPAGVRDHLSPDSHLLIAPHRQLHRLPWAALMPVNNRPLAALSIPVLVPSLQALLLLDQRPAPTPLPAGQGLVVAVSKFEGGRPPLPQVRQEAALLQDLLAPAGHLLTEAAATKAALSELAAEAGLATRYAFLHIASHAFHEPHTGWLSGIALHHEELWLDELWALAPLPALVTLSACSSSQSRLYAGDEHVSLVTTGLSAGARQVIGSLWPVVDTAAPQLMHELYQQIQAGHRPAASLALAQRAALARGVPAALWGGFCCTGLP